jgi:flap endonuclease-1
MGVSLSELISGKELNLDDLKDKIVAIDAFNMLYQFLSSLRGPDGALLTDSKGRTTSHLVGLLSRTTKLMQKGIKLVFVFDGVAPDLKQKERDRRRELKEKAQTAYEQAQSDGDEDAMRKFAMRTTSLTPEMVESAKQLILALGLPIVNAPSEGEAQAAYMQANGKVDFVASQDTDSLLYGATAVIKNLSLAGKRKKVSKLAYETITPQLLTASDILNGLGIDRKRLIILSMLVGTDFNVGGVKGLGPKKSLALVRKYSDFNQLFLDIGWHENFEYDWHEVYDLFENMPTTDEYVLEWKPINQQALHELLVESYEFNVERVDSAVEKLLEAQKSKSQKGLSDFFG